MFLESRPRVHNYYIDTPPHTPKSSSKKLALNPPSASSFFFCPNTKIGETFIYTTTFTPANGMPSVPPMTLWSHLKTPFFRKVWIPQRFNGNPTTTTHSTNFFYIKKPIV